MGVSSHLWLGAVPVLTPFVCSTYRTSHFTLRNAHVVSGDDCFALKGNSTFVTIENVYCQNSHGVSVGSLAQYPGVLDIVEHVKVVNSIA
jgi:galacturan 1,4-alpha-galacturonidase